MPHRPGRFASLVSAKSVFRLWLGFKPDVVVDGIPQSLFAAQIPFGRLDADMPQQELNLLEFSPGLVAKRAHVRRRSCGATFGSPQAADACLTTPQMTLGLKRLGANRPTLLIARKTAPSVTPASVNETRTASATQSGTGTVPMWPPFPIRSANTQCSSRCCRSSTWAVANSARRKPHPRRTATICVVALPAECCSIEGGKESPALLCCEPFANTGSVPVRAFHTAYAGGEVRAE